MNLSTFLQTKFNQLIFQNFNPDISFNYIKMLGKVYYFFNPHERNTIRNNVYEVIQNKNRRVVKNVYNGIMKHYFEKLLMAYYDLPKFLSYLTSRIEIKGQKLLDNGIKKGNGIILITAHFGAVEFLPPILASLGYQVNVTTKFKTQKLKRSLEYRAKIMKINIIDCLETQNIPILACKCLKHNEIFLTECDEVKSWIKDEQRTTRLFNKTVYLNKVIDVIARRTNAVVLAAFVRRIRDGHLLVEISNVKKVTPNETEYPESLENKMLKLFQIYVNKYPDQWYEWKSWQQMKVSQL